MSPKIDLLLTEYSDIELTITGLGTTTYRLKVAGLVIWLDTWLERPSVLPKYLNIEDVKEADYIFISHAHFDQYSLSPPTFVSTKLHC